MSTTEIVIMAVFGLLVVAGLVAGIRQSAARKARVRIFAAGRGCTVSATNQRLSALLDAALPEESWTPYHIVEVQPPPETTYLFAYSYCRKYGRSKPWTGFACLAEQSRPWCESPVTIHTRTPGFDALEGDRVEAGGAEFRGEFTVTCKRPEAAQTVVNTEVEHLLLEHAKGMAWNITVNITCNVVMAASFWAEKETEWDALIALVTKLRRAIP